MQQVELDTLRSGFVLPADLYSSCGIRLLNARMTLTDAMVQHLRGIDTTFYFADNVREFTQLSILREIDASRLHRRSDCHGNLVGIGGRLTNEYADVLEQHHHDALALGAFETVSREPERITAHRRQLTDAVIDELARQWDAAPLKVPVDEDLAFTTAWISASDARWPELDEIIRWRDRRVEVLRTQFAACLAGKSPDWGRVVRIVDELIAMLRRSPGHYPQIALLCPCAEDYLPDHALNTACLAIGLATRANWPEDYVRKAGVAGLVQDLGMLLLPQRVRVEKRQLNPEEREAIRKHPAYSVAMLGQVEEIDPFILCGVHQHHERLDGSGYPRALRGQNRISDLGQLLAVADMATALNEARPFRAQALPHEAVQTMVQYGADGILNRPLIRALVELVGMYPIGSYVRLSTGQVARVTGQHPDAVDRPIVQICTRPNRQIGYIVDLKLSQPWEISIMCGCPPPVDGVGEGRTQASAPGRAAS